jgi:hypothetical protein
MLTHGNIGIDAAVLSPITLVKMKCGRRRGSPAARRKLQSGAG